MTSGGQGAPFYRRYGRTLVIEAGDFAEEMLRGATVERLYG